nr:MAG TPA: hypothetical protein [Caudoviricetes sp.]
MSSSPSARHTGHFYDVLSRLPTHFYFFRLLRQSFCRTNFYSENFFCFFILGLDFYLQVFTVGAMGQINIYFLYRE